MDASPRPGDPHPFPGPGRTGVRLDAGYESGDTVSQYYDNLIAKLVVWAPDRESARRRMIRALGETEITGVSTTIPADLAILNHPDFITAAHSTNWVEERLDPASFAEYAHRLRRRPASRGHRRPTSEPRVLREVTAEVDGRRYAVKLWVPDVAPGSGGGGGVGWWPFRHPAGQAPDGHGRHRFGTVLVPMQGTIVKVLVAAG